VTTRLSGAGLYFSFGYELNEEWALGLSLAAIYTTLKLSRAVSNTPNNPYPATDGKVTFDDIDDWSPQAALGIVYTPKDSQWTLGLVYRSKTAVDLKGDLEAKNLPFSSGRAEVSFDMPEAYELGLAYQYTEKLKVFVQADYQLWSQFSDYTVNIGAGTDAYDRGWRDSYRVALGAQFELTPQQVIFVGTSYDMSPVTDKNRTFDAPTDDQLRLSASYHHRLDTLDFSLGLSLIQSASGKVDQTVEVTPGSGVFARTQGDFSPFNLIFVSASLEYHF